MTTHSFTLTSLATTCQLSNLEPFLFLGTGSRGQSLMIHSRCKVRGHGLIRQSRTARSSAMSTKPQLLTKDRARWATKLHSFARKSLSWLKLFDFFVRALVASHVHFFALAILHMLNLTAVTLHTLKLLNAVSTPWYFEVEPFFWLNAESAKLWRVLISAHGTGSFQPWTLKSLNLIQPGSMRIDLTHMMTRPILPRALISRWEACFTWCCPCDLGGGRLLWRSHFDHRTSLAGNERASYGQRKCEALEMWMYISHVQMQRHCKAM